MKEMTVYEAEDGTIYSDPAECERHDNELTVDKNKRFFEASVESFAETFSQDDHDNDLLILIRNYPKQFYDEVLAPIITDDSKKNGIVPAPAPSANTEPYPHPEEVAMVGWGLTPPTPPA